MSSDTYGEFFARHSAKNATRKCRATGIAFGWIVSLTFATRVTTSDVDAKLRNRRNPSSVISNFVAFSPVHARQRRFNYLRDFLRRILRLVEEHRITSILFHVLPVHREVLVARYRAPARVRPNRGMEKSFSPARRKAKVYITLSVFRARYPSFAHFHSLEFLRCASSRSSYGFYLYALSLRFNPHPRSLVFSSRFPCSTVTFAGVAKNS